MEKEILEKKDVTILFAGDSGDGMQLTGNQFTFTSALFGNDVSTFPNFPAEIRAPQGTVAGVSGFQLRFGSVEVFTPGDDSDVLVVMNAAALKANISKLKRGGVVIANTSGFDNKNLKLSHYEVNPLEDGSLDDYELHEVDITSLTREALVDSGLARKDVDRSKNMFVLGFLYWMYSRDLASTIQFIEEKFAKKPELIESNLKVLKTGYHYGDTSETFGTRYQVKKAKLPKGKYRSIMGNQAAAYGIIAAAKQAGLKTFYGSYPIPPASDILHELSKHKNFGVKTYQAEDEIAAICAAIGASFGGALGVTASSGPGIALKGEALGLAVMLELPLLVINVQRGGPSTGLPTKTEQSDLMQALYGRNGEAPIPVIAARTPSDCFSSIMEAIRISVEHMTPVMFLSDGYLANGAEPWAYPEAKDLPKITVPKVTQKPAEGEAYLPYLRDEKLVREWAIPGMEGLMHRLGGLEKEDRTGNISYDPENHEKMVRLRAEKVERIADFIPDLKIEQGPEKGKVLVLGWGSTYGSIRMAVDQCIKEGLEVSQAHFRYLNPFPKNTAEIMASFDHVIIPEINDKQLVHVIRSKFLMDAIPFSKIQGLPFTSSELVAKIKEIYA
ncbi:MAG TPA: 2-oxoglutarate ferredoxin oxidoreductase subunit alpha [Flavobacteriales bacterium]|nr:2-oxoglutarate ferredoxin oxidoreductase subunit alpha [Flavobacteriales bacterium]